MKFVTLLGGALISTSIIAQVSVTVTTDAGNTTQSFYSLQNGVQGTAPLAEWDLAFEINSFNSSILVNTAKGLAAFETPVAIGDWATLTAPDEASWTPVYNSITYWSAGALTTGNNLELPDGFNVGWGEYNINTHVIAGTKVYVIKLVDETYKKLRINSLASSTYSFTYSDLDGTNEQTGSLVKTAFAGKNFGYFSFATGTTLDREPVAAEWDLLFTKYTAFVPTAYPVAGVLQNKEVEALQVDGVDPSMADWNSAPFDSAISIIGSDWKTYDQANAVWTYAANRTYFVSDRSGNIWKLIFTGYGGGATGDMTFTQELVSATGLVEALPNPALVLYPNPVQNGRTQLVLDRAMNNATLSIVDMAGKIVQQQKVSATAGLSLVQVDLTNLNKGMYLARLEASNGSSTARVVID